MIRDLFFKDFGWKLFSLLLAAFIWITVNRIISEPKPATVSPAASHVRYSNVPVSVVATAADTHLYGINSNTVSVTVSGPSEVMNTLQANQIHASVDLSDFDDKTRDLRRRVEVTVPWGVTVVDVEPAEIRVVPPKK
jgi:YbbR domain-containing protein